METKFCHMCGRQVHETIHTFSSWKHGYFTKKRDGKEIHICVDCTDKEKKNK